VVGNVLGSLCPVHEYYQMYFSDVQSSGMAEIESVLHLTLTIFVRIKQRAVKFAFLYLHLLGKAGSEEGHGIAWLWGPYSLLYPFAST